MVIGGIKGLMFVGTMQDPIPLKAKGDRASPKFADDINILTANVRLSELLLV